MILAATEKANPTLMGLWQRVFFIELDRARKRTVSVVVIGQPERGRAYEGEDTART